MSDNSLSKAELKQLQDYENKIAELRSAYGQQQYVIDSLERTLQEEREEKELIFDELDSLADDYQEFMVGLHERYGSARVNLEDGVLVGD